MSGTDAPRKIPMPKPTAKPATFTPTPAEPPEPAVAERRHLALNKAGHEFRFRYDAGNERQVLAALAEMAGDPSQPLDWFDAAVLCHQLGGHMSAELEALLPDQAA